LREQYFLTRYPGLATGSFRITSPADKSYNCVAWAGGDDAQKWNPDPWGLFYWPDEARNDSLEGWIEAFARLGYRECADDTLETGFEKLVIYGTERGPSHMARQLPSGLWTSKLGESEYIEHQVEGLEGLSYGNVLVYLRREVTHGGLAAS
jgi:hypothetical protein